ATSTASVKAPQSMMRRARLITRCPSPSPKAGTITARHCRSGGGKRVGTGEAGSIHARQGAPGMAAARPAPPPAIASLDSGTRRLFDARPDTADFRDRMFEPTLVDVPTESPLEQFLALGIPVLDQGSDGACTAFGLATVAHVLLRRR